MRRRWELPENFFSPTARSVWPRIAMALVGRAVLCPPSDGAHGVTRPTDSIAARLRRMMNWLAMAMLWSGPSSVMRQDQRIIQATRSLHDGPAAGAAAENRNLPRLARGHVHFGLNLVRVADDDERLRRFPKTQRFMSGAGFAPIQQRLVAGEIFGGRGECADRDASFQATDFAGVRRQVMV